MAKWQAHVPGRRWMVLWATLLFAAFWGGQEVSAQDNWTIPSLRPELANAEFECADGYTQEQSPSGEAAWIPTGWTALYRDGSPVVASTRLRYRQGVCDASDGLPWVEKLSGHDSLTILSQDIEWSSAPGKPFDVILYQRVPVTVGGVYSLSGWLLSICGNNHKPFDCPSGNYISKSIGLDPRGGTDPDAPGVVWVENRKNFVDEQGEREGWQNLYTAVRALSPTVTVFVRLRSPFQWHGNLGFVDAFSLVRGPLSALAPLPKEVQGNQVEVAWVGMQSPDVGEMKGSTHQLLFDVQARQGRPGAWQEWEEIVSGVVGEGSTTYTAPCREGRVQFRVRARAEQPDDVEGLWPNQRYPGVWSEPVAVHFALPVAPAPAPQPPEGSVRVYVPHLAKPGSLCQ